MVDLRLPGSGIGAELSGLAFDCFGSGSLETGGGGEVLGGDEPTTGR
jgi:hypothetical protein